MELEKIKIGDLIKEESIHSSGIYEVSSIFDNYWISNPAQFRHKIDDIVEIYHFDGNDYKCVFRKRK